jgi:hypothetical protein
MTDSFNWKYRIPGTSSYSATTIGMRSHVPHAVRSCRHAVLLGSPRQCMGGFPKRFLSAGHNLRFWRIRNLIALLTRRALRAVNLRLRTLLLLEGVLKAMVDRKQPPGLVARVLHLSRGPWARRTLVVPCSFRSERVSFFRQYPLRYTWPCRTAPSR